MRFLFALILCCFASTVFADWYIVDKEDRVVSKCNYQPDQKDLDSRGEVAIFVKKDIALSEAEFRGNKVVKHVKTSKEIKAEKEQIAKEQEEKLIHDRADKIAKDQLVAEGVVFKYLKEE